MMKIAIYGSRRQHDSLAGIGLFLDVLRAENVVTVMHPKIYKHLTELDGALTAGIEVAETPDGADIAVSIGGDGTFLRTAQWVGDRPIPIVGVNTGHLGYLSALSLEELPKLTEYIRNDRFRIERRSLLCVEAPELPDYVGCYALNEVSLFKEETASMINAAVTVDGAPLADYRADGLIVCTSTGSTAYNLSIGGPIVQPTLDVIVLSPLAAHSLSMRPMVVDGRSSISIVPTGRSRHVRLAVDGRSALIDAGTEIRLTRAPFSVMVMQLSDLNFADILRHKLHWGEQ